MPGADTAVPVQIDEMLPGSHGPAHPETRLSILVITAISIF